MPQLLFPIILLANMFKTCKFQQNLKNYAV